MALNNEFKVKNDLNTLGRILSGGTDLATIFSPSNTSWALSATNGNFTVAGGDTVQFQGNNGVDVRVATGTDTVRISGIDATSSVKGVASFHADNFLVTNGTVTIKDGGILNAELAGSITDNKLSVISSTGKVSNSATTATKNNTANFIVARGANGEFSAGNITSSDTVEAVTVNATTGFRLNNAATSGHVLIGNGAYFVSSTLAASDVASGQALTKNDDTNVTLTLGGTPSTALLQSVSLSAGWAGQLSSGRGGTGNAFTKFTGPATSEKTFTLPNASATILTDNATVTVAQGGTGGTTQAAARTGLGATTLGSSLFTLTNVGAISFPRINANNTITTLDAVDYRTAIGAGTVTSVGGTGTVSGLTLTGTVTNSGNLTLGGTLSVVSSNFSSQTLRTFLAAPNGANGVPTFRTILASDVPTLNQNTTGSAGSAATLTTSRTIAISGDLSYTSPGFDGSANVIAAGTLATVNSNVGSFTNASVTVNAKGLVTAASSGTAPVTTVTGTSPVVSSGGTTPAISLAANYGDTLNPYASKTQKTFLAAPNAANGVPTFRTILASDVPTLNQNTTGSAGTLATTQLLWGQPFNGSQTVTGSLTGVGNITGSGAITIQPFATNQDISLTTSGTGEVNIAKVDIDSGAIDGTTIGASTASTGSFTQVVVDNITIDGNTISSTNANGDIILTPNGIGDVSIAADTLKIGDTNPVLFTTNGAATLTINTNGGTNSGTIQIAQGANGDITLSPNGTGNVAISKADINGGTIDGVSIGTASAATQLIVDQVEIDSETIGLKSGSSATELRINTRNGATPIVFNGGNAGANAIISSGISGDLILGTHLNDAARARLTLDDATNGNITFGLNGTGSVVIPRADINAGTIDGTTIGASSASTGRFTQVVVDNITIDGNTVSSTNSNGNIDLTPNGTGEVNITKVDIDGGTINGTTIGLTVPASAHFTGIDVSGNVNISGSLFVAGSSTTINTVDLVVRDPIIYLAEGNEGDTIDMGFAIAYDYDVEPHKHGGLIRDNSSKQWTLFSGLTTEILSATQIPFSDPSLVIDTLRANIIGTVTGNLSGMAAQIANGSVSTNSIVNDAVTYAKIQNVSQGNRILGRKLLSSGSGDVEEIACTDAGFALLDDASASDQRNTLGVGSAQSVTFGEVIVNNGTISVLNDVFNASSSNNTHTLTTFAKANYNSAKFTIQIKQGNNRCLFEVLATNNNGTWDGTVYGLVGADLLDNIDITTISTTVDLAFTFKGTATARTMTVYAQAISD